MINNGPGALDCVFSWAIAYRLHAPDGVIWAMKRFLSG